MKVFIGEKIKELRLAKGITQEALAGFLGVSFQAVSKWERNLSYPDIETIPVIANYFGVTIDTIMGNPQIKAEACIEKLLSEYEKLQLLCTPEGDLQRNTLAQKAYEEFPYDYRIINMYRQSLVCKKDEADFDEVKPTIRFLCKKLLDNCADVDLRQSAIDSLILISDSTEEKEKLLSMLK